MQPPPQPAGAQPQPAVPPAAAAHTPPPGTTRQPAAPGQTPLPPPPPGVQPHPGVPGGRPPLPPTPQQTEAEALRSWVAQLDRKLGLRTYIVLAASLLALACSIVAVILAIDARDNSASPDDVAALEEQIAALQATGAAPVTPIDPATGLPEAGAGDAVPPVDSASDLDSIESEIDDLVTTDIELQQRITALEQDVEDLRGEISRNRR